MSGGDVWHYMNPLQPVTSSVDSVRDLARGHFKDSLEDAGRSALGGVGPGGVGVATGDLFKKGVDKATNKKPPDPQDGSADLAQLTHDMWDDYVTRFIPQENTLIDWATNPATARDAANRAGALADRSAATQPGILKRQLNALGVQPDAQQTEEIGKQTALSSTLSRLSATNNTRDAITQQQNGALIGSAGRPSVTQRVAALPAGPGGA